MEEKTTNPSIARAVLLSVVALPAGIFGFISMFASPTPGLMLLCIGSSAICSLVALVSASNGLEDLKQTNEETKKEKRLAGTSILLSVLNFVLLFVYFASY